MKLMSKASKYINSLAKQPKLVLTHSESLPASIKKGTQEIKENP